MPAGIILFIIIALKNELKGRCRFKLKKNILRIGLMTFLLLILSASAVFAEAEGESNIGETLPIWSCIPFVGMLLSIAIFPLVKPEFWERNQLKIALMWGLIFLIPFGIAYGIGELTFQVLEIIPAVHRASVRTFRLCRRYRAEGLNCGNH